VAALNRLPVVASLAALTALAVLAVPAPRAVAAGNEAARLRDARAHYEEAVVHYNLDEFAQALAEFREAYRIKPDASFLFNIAQCHRKLGDVDAALDFYRKYLRSLPEAPNRVEVERMIAELRARKDSTPAAGAPATDAPSPAPIGIPPASVVAVPAAPEPAPRAEALVVAPAPPSPAPFYQRWWFWTAVGAAVVGGGIAAYAATRPAPQPYVGNLSPGLTEVR
jgi:tetratricopeptide (TPR) repeat protein